MCLKSGSSPNPELGNIVAFHLSKRKQSVRRWLLLKCLSKSRRAYLTPGIHVVTCEQRLLCVKAAAEGEATGRIMHLAAYSAYTAREL